MAEGIFDPAGIKTLAVIVANEGLLLLRFTVRPPAGATVPRLRGRLTVCPTVVFETAPRLINCDVAVTVAVPVIYPGAAADRVAVPLVTPL